MCIMAFWHPALSMQYILKFKSVLQILIHKKQKLEALELE